MTADDRKAIEQMLAGQEERLGQRISGIDGRLETLTNRIVDCQARRDHCLTVQRDLGRDVWGNGKDGLKDRVKVLETVGAIRGKGFWVLVAGLASLVSAIIGGLVQAAGVWWR